MKMNEILIYKIRTLFGSRGGESQTESRNGIFMLGEQKLNVTFDITMMKMDEEVAVFIKNFRTKIPIQCSKCLKKFDHEMTIDMAEREFLFESSNEEEVPEDKADLFFANIKLMEINIEEMLRQEILLHFPVFPVCSLKCKGLCLVCGKNQNKKLCRHKNAEIPTKTEVKPFAHLKKLLL